jgi:tRNA pseudouridine38-40 synthase
MPVYALRIAWIGTRYAGWQRQPDAPTVQQAVEEAVAAWAGAQIAVVGASRTDAGVHARGQVAHLRCERELALGALVHGTNGRLPEDVRVLAAAQAPDTFNAQRDGIAKLYRYRLHLGRVTPPGEAPFAWRIGGELDRAALSAATRCLPGRHDFSCFALAGGAHDDPRRSIHSARWEGEGERLTLAIVGDGFLRGMVRGLVGTLVDVAAGRRPVGNFADLLAGGHRGEAGPTAPAHGLCLERVDTRPPLPGLGDPGARADPLW